MTIRRLLTLTAVSALMWVGLILLVVRLAEGLR